MKVTTVLVTGSAGFIGKHLMEALARFDDVRTIGYDLGTPEGALDEALAKSDIVFHLAGVNRPQSPDEYRTGNAEFTASFCSRLAALGRTPRVVMASSIQAELENPYGVSKRQAEQALRAWSEHTGGRVVVFRLKNVFGKWCRPNYNSVTATFCHNIAHDLPITVSDPSKELELVYIDDVVAEFLKVLDTVPGSGPSHETSGEFSFREISRSFKTTLGHLAGLIQSFRASRKNLLLRPFTDEFTRCLYATYSSYLDGDDFAYGLEVKSDDRGCLAEFIKCGHFGQIFVSRTKPGVTRGNHYHHTKTEKFLVLEGDGIVRLRHILNGEVIEHRTSGLEFKVVDIPPGYTHSIENIGATEMVTLFWASEIFDPQKPDTYFQPVLVAELAAARK